MRNRKKSISWFWVVVAFIIFWPLGFVLLFIKLSRDRSSVVKTKSTSKILSSVVWVLLVLGGISLFGAVIGEMGIFGVVVLFVIGGILLKRIANRTKCKGEKYKKYIDLIVNQNQTNIGDIANKSSVPYEDALCDLQDMIDEGYFCGAFIDKTKRTFNLTRPKEPAPPAKTIILACESCGAKVRATEGKEADCDYCGTYLQ